MIGAYTYFTIFPIFWDTLKLVTALYGTILGRAKPGDPLDMVFSHLYIFQKKMLI